jgi:hypothetical protein
LTLVLISTALQRGDTSAGSANGNRLNGDDLLDESGSLKRLFGRNHSRWPTQNQNRKAVATGQGLNIEVNSDHHQILDALSLWPVATAFRF